MMKLTHEQWIARINFEGAQAAKSPEGIQMLTRSLRSVETHLRESFNVDPVTEPHSDPWIELLRRYEAAMKWLGGK